MLLALRSQLRWCRSLSCRHKLRRRLQVLQPKRVDGMYVPWVLLGDFVDFCCRNHRPRDLLGLLSECGPYDKGYGALAATVAAILVAMQRRTDIEGLRAVAVLAVLLFHAGVPHVAGGYVGVDVFFVLSGFLITSLLVAEKESEGFISLGAFYSRRVRRLLPVSAAVGVSTLVASYIWLEPLRIRSLVNDLFAVATFSSNFVFAHRGADYLQSTLPPSPLQHYWSLAVEEQFYIVWPVLVALVCIGVTKSSRLRLRVGITAAVVAVASFVACMVMMNTSQPWAFFSPHTRAFELAIGALVAVVPMHTSRLAQRIVSALAWCGVAGVIACVVLFTERTTFPGPWALAPVCATALVLRGGSTLAWSPNVVLKFAPFQWMGSRSYSAYLWHWPVLIIAVPALGHSLSVAEGLVCLLIALALSEVSFRFIENPVRRNIRIRGVRAFALAVSLLSVVTGSAVLARNNPPRTSTGVVATTPTLLGSTTLPVGETTTTIPTAPDLPAATGPVDAIAKAAAATGLPSNLTPTLQQAVLDQPIIYKNNCHANFSTIHPKTCVFGAKDSTKVVGLFGDSHAAQWFPAFEQVAKTRGWKLMTYTKRGCPPVDIATYSKVLGQVYKQCGPWRDNVMKQMVTDGVQVVFIAHFDRLLSATTRTPMWQKEWRAALQTAVGAFQANNITPVLIEDTPYPGQDIPTCLSRHYTNVQLCSPTIGMAYRPDMEEMLHDFHTQGVNVLWVHDWFCTATVCPTIVGNVLMYRDDNHMTVTYSRLIAPLLEASIGSFVDWYTRTP